MSSSMVCGRLSARGVCDLRQQKVRHGIGRVHHVVFSLAHATSMVVTLASSTGACRLGERGLKMVIRRDMLTVNESFVGYRSLFWRGKKQEETLCVAKVYSRPDASQVGRPYEHRVPMATIALEAIRRGIIDDSNHSEKAACTRSGK